jgi:hypothetical protein
MKQVSTNKEGSKINNLIAVLTVVTIVVSLISLSFSYITTNQLKEKITGFATGYVNITIMTTIAINVSPQDINWGPGTINTTGGWTNATLTTSTGKDGNVSCGSNPLNGLPAIGSECGNWTATGLESQMTRGFNITNMGTVNASVNLSSDIRSAHNLFGGEPADVNEAYEWKATLGEANSCEGGTLNTTWNAVNGVLYNNVCNNLGYEDTKDTIIVDIRMTVPYNSNVTSSRERRTDSITITATAKY